MKKTFTILSLLLFTIFFASSSFAYEQKDFDTSNFTSYDEITEADAMWMIPQSQNDIFYLLVDGDSVVISPDQNFELSPMNIILKSNFDETIGYSLRITEPSTDTFQIKLYYDDVALENKQFSIIKATMTIAEEIVYLNDVDDPSTVEEIISNLQATDDLDGDLSDEIFVMMDMYSEDMNTVDQSALMLGVKDSNYNTTMISILIDTRDVTAPTVEFTDYDSNTNIIRVPLDSTLEEVFDLIPYDLTIIDSYEGELSAMSIVYDSIYDDVDAIDTSIEGDYPQIIRVSDSSGNESELEYILRVQDMTAPIIDGPDEIMKKDNYILSSDFFLSYFTASDNLDGDITSDIDIVSNEYIGNADTVGTYEIVLSIQDSDGNASTHTLTIKVKDDTFSYLIVDRYQWIIPNNIVMTDLQFVQELKRINDLPDDNFVFTSVSDTYTGNASTNGSYEKVFTLASGSGSNYSRDISLSVVDPNINVIEDDPTLFENIGDFIDNAFIFFKKTWWMFGLAALVGFGIYQNKK